MQKAKKGFTLIEALAVLFVFVLITLSFYQVINVGTRYITDAKNRLGAISVANEKMEIIRNLKYDNVGVSGGIPSGDIPEDEDVTESGRTYQVHTFVQFVDDALDGTEGGTPDDIVPGDYKRVKVIVSWLNSMGNTEQVDLVSRFVPAGLESLYGDGTLAVNVYSDQPGGAGIPQSTVHIVNNAVSPAISITTKTDDNGGILLPGAEESFDTYQITVTKDGYETVTTLPAYPTTSYDPTDVNASVVANEVNTANIVQNKLTNLKIKTIDYLGESLADIDFHITGGRLIGTTHDAAKTPIYNIDTDATTDSNGEKDFNLVSPGNRNMISFDVSSTNYELIGTDPVFPFALLSAYDLTVTAKFALKNKTGILVKALKSEDNLPLSDAQIELKNSDYNYDVTQTTDDNGTAYFPTDANEFKSGTYDLAIIASGYKNYSAQVTISENALKIQSVTMTAL